MMFLVIVGALVISAVLIATVIPGIAPGGSGSVFIPPVDDDKEQVGANAYSQIEVAFDFESIDPDAQDNDGEDIDVDLYTWTPEANSRLVKDKYVDCSSAVPVMWDGSGATSVTVPESALCKMNLYKFAVGWASTPGKGDIETKLDDDIVITKKDLNDYSNGTDSNSVKKVSNDKTYMVCAVDTSEMSDMIPLCYLMELSDTTTLDTDEVANGGIEVVFEYQYYSDAVDEGRLTVTGECSDSEGNDVVLSSALDGAIHSSLTTATANLDLDCTVFVTVNKDGYALINTNPIAASQTEKAYAKFEPYGMNFKDGQNATWGKVLDSADFETVYTSSAPSPGTSGGNYTIWESLTACGVEITDDDTTGSLVNANKNLREGDGLNCLKDLYDKDAEMEIPITITNIVSADYDASTTANNTQLDANSGSSAESIMDISFYSPISATDYVAQDLDA